MARKRKPGSELDYIAEDLRPLAVCLTEIQTDPGNAREHAEKDVDAIAFSLREYGQRKPIVVNRRNKQIEAGNGTYMAALRMGWTHLAVVWVDDDPNAQSGFALADNRSAELSKWNEGRLNDLLMQWDEGDEFRKVLAFDDLEFLDDPVSGAGEVVEDEAPPPPANPITKPGDLWLLGDHRLLCGDSTKPEDVQRVMQGERASCVFTDPPYGVSIGAKNRLLNSVQKSGLCLEDIRDDSLSPEQLRGMLLPAFTVLRQEIMADDCTLFVSAPQGGDLGMMMMMQDAGLKVRHVLIWKKDQPTFSLGRLDYDYQHEPILLTWGKRHKRPMAGKHRTSVWEIDRERKCADHPTMKPVAVYANAYANNSEQGDLVSDIYAGSGTAFVAAEQLGRKCYGIENEPRYCDVIVQRWEKLTSKKAKRAKA